MPASEKFVFFSSFFQGQFFKFWSCIALMNAAGKTYTYYPLSNLLLFIIIR
jgi:hypothetical protein